MAAELDLAEFGGIACISGDGLVHEVYNGLYTRSDWEEKAARDYYAEFGLPIFSSTVV